MRGRVLAVVAVAAFSSGILAAPAAAATSSVTTVVVDAASNLNWSGTEVTGASAYATATVTGDGTDTPTGTVTYSFYADGTCVGTPVATTQVTLNADGSVPASSTTAALGAGSYSFQATYGGDSDNDPSPPPPSGCMPFTVALAAPSLSTQVLDETTGLAPSGHEVTGSQFFDTASIGSTVPGFVPTGTVTYSFYADGTCVGTPVATTPVTLNADGSVPASSTTAALGAGSYSFQALYSGDVNYGAATSTCEPFSVDEATPSLPTTVDDAATDGAWSGTETTGAGAYDTASIGTTVPGFTPTGTVTYTFFTNATCDGTGTPAGTVTVGADGSVPQSSTQADLGAGSYSFEAGYGGDPDYAAVAPSPAACESFTVLQGSPSPPLITNIPAAGSAAFRGSFTPSVSTNSDAPTWISSSTTTVCTVTATLPATVSFVGVGPCTLTAHVTADADWAAKDGLPQSFSVGHATPSAPAVTNIPSGAAEFGSFTAAIATTGDGVTFVTSSSPSVCTVGPDGHTVTFVFFGTCTLTAAVAQGAHFLPGVGGAQSFPVAPAPRGYWLVGSDGGIFSFGAASFYGSMGGIPLQRPVVGITPTASRNGYWLVASDGGIFSFGDSSFYGSIPGLGLHPAGSGLPGSLAAPIVGMVPSSTGHGYFMVASDGGVFAFGDARFAGSCPGIGGCSGAAVAVMPDRSGNGYWLVTSTGAVYAFGDAPFYGAPPPQSVAVVDAVATPDGRGYWVLYANGVVAGFGDAAAMGSPVGYVNSYNPATSIFPTADGQGYWVAAARGDVFAYGDAPFMGSMSAAGLNGEIIAAYGF